MMQSDELMHPKISARVQSIEAAKRKALYQSLDLLLRSLGTIGESAGIDRGLWLEHERALLASIARRDPLDTDRLIDFALKLNEEAVTIVEIIRR